MSVKLSELFQIAVEALDEDAQQELSFIGFPRHETRYDELKQSAEALRAIAPALVDGLQTLLSQCPYSRARVACDCVGCTLLAAMKEAGVTCE